MNSRNNKRDVLAYLLTQYPLDHELSAGRVAKMIYLSDWIMSTQEGHQITDTEWYYNDYGPYVEDFINIANNNADFQVKETTNVRGNFKQLLRYNGEEVELDPSSKQVIDKVIEISKKLNWNKFMSLIYSTYPMMTVPKHQKLDLPSLAKQMKEEHAKIATD